MLNIKSFIGPRICANTVSAEINKPTIIINNGIEIIRPSMICLKTLLSTIFSLISLFFLSESLENINFTASGINIIGLKINKKLLVIMFPILNSP